MNAVIQYILYLAVLVILAIPLGAYIKKAMNGEKTFLSKILSPCENAVYKVMRVNKDEQMNWEKICRFGAYFFRNRSCIFIFTPDFTRIFTGKPAGTARCEVGFIF